MSKPANSNPRHQQPTGYHHGDLRPALVQAAQRLVEERGAEQASLRAIAREAGVSHAALYHHFPDRQALLAAVAATGFSSLRDRMLEGADATDAPQLTRLQEAGVAYVLFATENPHLYRLMFSDQIADREQYPDLQAAADGAYGALGQLLRQTTDRQATEDLGDHPAARASWAMVHGLAMLLIDGRFGEDARSKEAAGQLAREVTQVLGRGLRAMVDLP